MGGTMTAREQAYQDWFVTECVRAMNEYPHTPLPERTREVVFARNEQSQVRCVAITFETARIGVKGSILTRCLTWG
jgi:elongator complex protein 3